MQNLVFSGASNLAQKPLFPRTAKALAVLAAIDISASVLAGLLARKDK